MTKRLAPGTTASTFTVRIDPTIVGPPLANLATWRANGDSHSDRYHAGRYSRVIIVAGGLASDKDRGLDVDPTRGVFIVLE